MCAPIQHDARLDTDLHLLAERGLCRLAREVVLEPHAARVTYLVHPGNLVVRAWKAKSAKSATSATSPKSPTSAHARPNAPPRCTRGYAQGTTEQCKCRVAEACKLAVQGLQGLQKQLAVQPCAARSRGYLASNAVTYARRRASLRVFGRAGRRRCTCPRPAGQVQHSDTGTGTGVNTREGWCGVGWCGVEWEWLL